jgi:hypothetical protein
VAGVAGLELGNVGFLKSRPNSLVCQNIFVPETFGEELDADHAGGRIRFPG